MTGIVRYSRYNGALGRYALRHPYGRAAYTAMRGASFAYRNRGNIKRAAKLFARARKKYKSKKRRVNRSENAPPAASKVKGTFYGDIAEVNQRLYTSTVVFPAMETSNTVYSQRSGPYIFLKGIKICLLLENTFVDALNVHFALVQSKGTNVGTIEDDFFSDPYATNSRLASWTDNTSGAFDHKLECVNLNPHKWNIIFHKRWVMDPKVMGGTDERTIRDGSWLKRYESYVRINKRIFFEFPSSTEPERPWYFIMWNQKSSMSATQSYTTANLIGKMNTKVYFKDLK